MSFRKPLLLAWGLVASSLTLSAQTYPDTDVVIISNNDLDPQNSRRDSALYLASTFTCSQAKAACALLHESLFSVSPETSLSYDELAGALISERHGATLTDPQALWVALDGGC